MRRLSYQVEVALESPILLFLVHKSQKRFGVPGHHSALVRRTWSRLLPIERPNTQTRPTNFFVNKPPTEAASGPAAFKSPYRTSSGSCARRHNSIVSCSTSPKRVCRSRPPFGT